MIDLFGMKGLSRWKIDISDYIKNIFGDVVKKAYVLCMDDSTIEDVKQDSFYLCENMDGLLDNKRIEFDNIDLLLVLSNGKTVELWNADNSLTIEKPNNGNLLSDDII